MFIKYFKLIIILLFYYQNPSYSKSDDLNNFNSDYLSNYFSGVVAYKNKNNSDALRFFKFSKILLNKHDPYLEKYIDPLVAEGKVRQAVNEINQNLNKNNSRFFEAGLILAIDSLKKKILEKAKFTLSNLMNLLIIIKYHYLFMSPLSNTYILFRKVKF